MERLIADANEYAASIGQASDLSINSFSDIVTAIDLVQQKQGIAGATAAEAATTIEGSLNMTKAAWDNLVAGLANPEADTGQLLDNLIVSIVGDKNGTGLLNNIIPAVKTAIEGIGKFIQAAVPALSAQLPSLIQSFLPVLIDSSITLVTNLIAALPSIITALVEMMPQLVEMVVNALSEALVNIAPILISEAPIIVKALATGILSSVKTIRVAALNLLNTLSAAIYSGLISVAKKAGTSVKKIPQKIKTGLGNLKSVGTNLIEGLWGGIKSKFDSVVSKVKALAARLPKAVKKVLGIASPSKVFEEVGKWIPEGLALGIEQNMGKVYNVSDVMADATTFTPAAGLNGFGINENMGGTINIYLNYDASSDANDMLKDIARGVRRYRMAGVL